MEKYYYIVYILPDDNDETIEKLYLCRGKRDEDGKKMPYTSSTIATRETKDFMKDGKISWYMVDEWVYTTTKDQDALKYEVITDEMIREDIAYADID